MPMATAPTIAPIANKIDRRCIACACAGNADAGSTVMTRHRAPANGLNGVMLARDGPTPATSIVRPINRGGAGAPGAAAAVVACGVATATAFAYGLSDAESG